MSENKKKVVFAVDPGFAQVKYSIGGVVGVIPSAVAEPLPAMEGLGKGPCWFQGFLCCLPIWSRTIGWSL